MARKKTEGQLFKPRGKQWRIGFNEAVPNTRRPVQSGVRFVDKNPTAEGKSSSRARVVDDDMDFGVPMDVDNTVFHNLPPGKVRRHRGLVSARTFIIREHRSDKHCIESKRFYETLAPLPLKIS